MTNRTAIAGGGFLPANCIRQCSKTKNHARKKWGKVWLNGNDDEVSNNR